MKLNVDFPAWQFDNLFDEATLANVVAEFPPAIHPGWQTFHGEREERKQQGGPACWGPATTAVLLELMSPKWCAQVAALLDSRVLVADIVGGGMHQSGPGAHLDLHVDFDRHPDTGWRRKVNFLIYLNHGWREEWGGCLELGGITIAPEFGRAVIFETSERSWHGHPVPVADGHVRRSLAVYLYDPLDVVAAPGHSTLWKE